MTGKYLDGVRLYYPLSLVGFIHLCILCEVADVKIQCLIDKRSVNHIIHIIFSESSQELSDKYMVHLQLIPGYYTTQTLRQDVTDARGMA